MTNDYWLEAKNISCIKNDYEVVKDLNLKLKYCENVALIGPNGSGKSSIIDLINRNIYPVIKKDTIFKLFNKELINIWEIRKKISTVNYDVKTRINEKLTVLDLINSFQRVNNVKIAYEFSKRREGDVEKIVASNELALKILNWYPKKGLEDMCRDGWKWKINNPDGYT